MSIVQAGAINTTALVVPDLYVQIVPPQNLILNGVPTDVVGVVGTASWGPVDQAVICSNMADYARAFGPIMARKYDMGTAVATAVQQGAQNFRCVRVTDDTDTAASYEYPSTTMTMTALYTGSLGNSIGVTLATGSAASSYRFTIALPGMVPEVFDNITDGITNLTFTRGTGYTIPPPLVFPSPTLPGARLPNIGTALEVATAAPHSGDAGTGWTTGDVTTATSDGTPFTFTVTASAGAVTGLAPLARGEVTTTIPSNPVTMTAVSGTGVALKAIVSWGVRLGSGWSGGAGYVGTEGNPTMGTTVYGTGASVVANYSPFFNLRDAINNGNGAFRGPSKLVAAATGGGIGVGWATGSYTFGIQAGGTGGATTITAATLIGTDTVPREGMYALRGQGCSIAVLADADDSTQWTTQAAFGYSEGVYMMAVTPSGDTIANAVSAKNTAGLDDYSVKLMFGDWLEWNDQTNGVLRQVSPQGFVAGRLANLSPEQSSLNKRLYSVVGSQKSGAPGTGQSQTYSAAELSVLFQAGIDVISNPQPGGNYWGVRDGHNSSSNPAVNGDNYTRLTNYIAATLAAGMGLYVGQVVNATLFKRIRATQLSFLSNMLGQGILGSVDGSLPYGVICDISNNPHERTSLGYVQSDCQVQYQAINEKFIVNIEGGQTVTVNRQTVPAGQG